MLTLQVGRQFVDIRPELQYVVDIYNMSYTDVPDVSIGYGIADDIDIEMIPGDAVRFFVTSNPTPDINSWIEWRARNIPIFFQKEVPKPLIRIGYDTIVIEADVLASAFYFLSLWQEVHSDVRDHLGRFPAEESFLYQHNLLSYPVVNYYFDILTSAVEHITGQKPIPRLEKHSARKFAAVITHDIDRCQTGWKQDTYRALSDMKLIPALSALFRKSAGKDIWFNFDTILDLEKQFGVPSVFFFIPEHRKSGRYPNADYKITSEKMILTMKQIRENGSEIAIHPSIGSGWDQERLHAEIKMFPEEVNGCRFHYLAFSVPESFHLIDSTSLQYDSSLGFAESIGFRNGFCYPFKPFDYESRQAYTFFEFPLVIMDRTLIDPEYMNLRPEKANLNIRALIDEVQKFTGMLTVLWHNNSFSGYKYRGWKDPFVLLLNEVLERDGKFLRPLTIIDELMEK